MQIPLLTTASLSLLLAAAAATPLVTSNTAPAADGTTFESSTPPKPRMVAGIQGGGIAIAGAAAGAGAAGAACACCRKKQRRGEKRYRAGQDERGCGAQRRRKTQDGDEGMERAEVDEERGGAEDGFGHVQGDARVIDMPETPPPSYARLARPEGEEIELEARPVGKGEDSKGV